MMVVAAIFGVIVLVVAAEWYFTRPAKSMSWEGYTGPIASKDTNNDLAIAAVAIAILEEMV